MKKFIFLLIMVSPVIGLSQYDVEAPKKESFAEKRGKEISKREDTWGCNFIPYCDYKAGMKFYFPRDDYKEKDDMELMYYEIYSEKEAGGKKKRQPALNNKIYYKDIAGKLFEIIKIEEIGESYDKKTYYILKQVDGDLLIKHRVVLGLDYLRKQYEESKDQTFVMNYAVYIPEIDGFKEKFLEKDIYTKFNINGIKYQKVKIIAVGAGVADSPIRVVIETEDGQKEQKDFCTCGTNVSSSFIDTNSFDNFFQWTNPKDDYNGSEKYWDLICHGKIVIGMSEEDLILSWGKPKNINERVTNGLKSKQYVYYDQYVYVDNGKITSFQSSK